MVLVTLDLQRILNNSLTRQFEKDAAKIAAPLNCDVRAPSEAWCILQGERPCRERTNHPPVSSVAPVAEQRIVSKPVRGKKSTRCEQDR